MFFMHTWTLSLWNCLVNELPNILVNFSAHPRIWSATACSSSQSSCVMSSLHDAYAQFHSQYLTPSLLRSVSPAYFSSILRHWESGSSRTPPSMSIPSVSHFTSLTSFRMLSTVRAVVQKKECSLSWSEWLHYMCLVITQHTTELASSPGSLSFSMLHAEKRGSLVKFITCVT